MNERMIPTPEARPTRFQSDSPAAGSALRIYEGNCWAFFAFDVGYGIDLDAAQKILVSSPAGAEEAAHRAGISHRRRAPKHLQFHPTPLQIDQPPPDPEKFSIRGFPAPARVECTLYDFGAVSVAYRFPIEGGEAGLSLTDLIPLAEALGDNAGLVTEARRRVEMLASRAADAIERPQIVDLVEDYTVFHARRWTPSPGAQSAIESSREAVAKLLLAESGRLSSQAVDAALKAQLSYGPEDIAVVDWNASLLLDAQADDTLAVLEFANVELLEMRFIDDRLDSILERSYAHIMKRDAQSRFFRSPLGQLIDPHRIERGRLATLRMDSAVLFEGINNALKLIGDQHLARLYALAASRLHLADWDQSILRKLHTIDELYQKLADEKSGRRMEVLEWIIIILIAVSIVLPFIWGGAK